MTNLIATPSNVVGNEELRVPPPTREPTLDGAGAVGCNHNDDSSNVIVAVLSRLRSMVLTSSQPPDTDTTHHSKRPATMRRSLSASAAKRLKEEEEKEEEKKEEEEEEDKFEDALNREENECRPLAGAGERNDGSVVSSISCSQCRFRLDRCTCCGNHGGSDASSREFSASGYFPYT